MSERTQRDVAPDKDWGRAIPIVHANARARHRAGRIAAPFARGKEQSIPF